MLPSKELASVHELFQNVLAYRLVTPFALCKERRALSVVDNQIDLFLRARPIVRSPPAAHRCRNHIKLARARKLVHILPANKLKYCTHIVGKMWLDAPIRHLGHVVLDQADVLWHKPVPEPKHLIAQLVHSALVARLIERQLALGNSKRSQLINIVLHVTRRNSSSAGNLRYLRTALGNCLNDGIVLLGISTFLQ